MCEKQTNKKQSKWGPKHKHPHQKQSKRCHEAFFGEFPCATILFLINLLKAAEVYIQDASVDDAESKKAKT